MDGREHGHVVLDGAEGEAAAGACFNGDSSPGFEQLQATILGATRLRCIIHRHQRLGLSL